ncbi:MAG TPA: UbiA family prenyltransferase, partial [Pirellulales bacterium]|nr:UbiA family prenyltransferase [Pirellulales bacterium]
MGESSGARMLDQLDFRRQGGVGLLNEPPAEAHPRPSYVDLDDTLIRTDALIDGTPRSRTGVLLSALRPHQWVKNLLVLLPLFLAHEWNQTAKLALAVAALAAFSCAASAVYVVNDLLDIDADRRHPSKRRRPFAAGELSARAGLLLACVVGLVGLAIALGCVSLPFTGWLTIYLISTT